MTFFQKILEVKPQCDVTESSSNWQSTLTSNYQNVNFTFWYSIDLQSTTNLLSLYYLLSLGFDSELLDDYNDCSSMNGQIKAHSRRYTDLDAKKKLRSEQLSPTIANQSKGQQFFDMHLLGVLCLRRCVTAKCVEYRAQMHS